MEELLGSKTKTLILLYLGLRGGTTGRRLARVLGISTTQVFKALRQFVRADIVLKTHPSGFYALNPHYPFYEELIRMIQKEAQLHKKNIRRFMPVVPEERHVDPIAVYQLLSLRKAEHSAEKFSDLLRQRYA